MLVVTREGDRHCKLRPSQRAMVALVHLGRLPCRPARCVRQPHPGLQQLEVGAALFVQRQHLPVQHGGRRPQRGAQRPQLGIGGRDLLSRPGP